jgi:hypothetical protein
MTDKTDFILHDHVTMRWSRAWRRALGALSVFPVLLCPILSKHTHQAGRKHFTVRQITEYDLSVSVLWLYLLCTPTRGRKQAPARIIIRLVADAALHHGDHELVLETRSEISCWPTCGSPSRDTILI